MTGRVFGSVCSGIEAASCAWNPLGWRAAFLSEIDPHCRTLLQQRLPETPLHGDFQTIQEGDYEPVDVLVGGTPCQDFSVAGLRAGITGDRGCLSLEFIRLAARLRPTWLVFENVPGLLSDDDGRAFGAFLGGLAVVGYGFAYRVLDAQFAGLAQRRERVFVVGYLGDWRPAAAVLFESHGLSWNPPPRRGARQGVAGSLTTRAGNGSRPAGGNCNLVADVAGTLGNNGKAAGTATGQDARNGLLVPLGLGEDGETARSLNACHTASGRHDVSVDTFVAHTLRGTGFDASEDGTGRGTPLVPVLGFNARQDPDSWEEHSGALDTRSPQAQAIVFDTTQVTQPNNRSNPQPGDPCHTLASHGHPPTIAFGISGDAVDRTGEGDGSAVQRAGLGIMEECAPAIRARPNNSVAYSAETGVTEFLPQSNRVYLEDGVAPTVQATGKRGGQRTPAIAFHQSQSGTRVQDVHATLDANNGPRRRSGVVQAMQVRRLTPRECERLQGFVDDWTRVRERHYAKRKITDLRPAERWEPAEDGGWWLMTADGPRYQQLGNSMAVPVLRWLGKRIDLVEELMGRRNFKEGDDT